MKVNILYEISDNPYGGGNQFLKALKKEFVKKGLYASEKEADVLLYNSHHNLSAVEKLKTRFPDKKFIHRVDGPIRLYNNMEDQRDFVVYEANHRFADGTVFQSEWSSKANIDLGMKMYQPSKVIHNAVDSSIFFNQKLTKNSKKKRIIAASFSPNSNKGFEFYKKLEEALDPLKYEFYFAGQSPVYFSNNLGCLGSVELAAQLNLSDVYVTASRNDPCSNSLLEAISCGIPVLALNSGGHPELVKDPNMLFNNVTEAKGLIQKICFDKNSTALLTPRRRLSDVAEEYLGFFREVYESSRV